MEGSFIPVSHYHSKQDPVIIYRWSYSWSSLPMAVMQTNNAQLSLLTPEIGNGLSHLLTSDP